MTFEDHLRRERNRNAMRDLKDDIHHAVWAHDYLRKRRVRALATAGLLLALGACAALPPPTALATEPTRTEDKLLRHLPVQQTMPESMHRVHIIPVCTASGYGSSMRREALPLRAKTATVNWTEKTGVLDS